MFYTCFLRFSTSFDISWKKPPFFTTILSCGLNSRFSPKEMLCSFPKSLNTYLYKIELDLGHTILLPALSLMCIGNCIGFSCVSSCETNLKSQESHKHRGYALLEILYNDIFGHVCQSVFISLTSDLSSTHDPLSPSERQTPSWIHADDPTKTLG